MQQFENSEQIAFNVEFARDEADGSSQRLVWNHRKVGLTLTDDGLIAHVRNNDNPFYEGFRVDNLGLNDTDVHQISLMVDQASDRLQVLVDGNVVLDEQASISILWAPTVRSGVGTSELGRVATLMARSVGSRSMTM